MCFRNAATTCCLPYDSHLGLKRGDRSASAPIRPSADMTST